MRKVFSEDEGRSEASSGNLDSGLHRQNASVFDTEVYERATNKVMNRY